MRHFAEAEKEHPIVKIREREQLSEQAKKGRLKVRYTPLTWTPRWQWRILQSHRQKSRPDLKKRQQTYQMGQFKRPVISRLCVNTDFMEAITGGFHILRGRDAQSGIHC